MSDWTVWTFVGSTLLFLATEVYAKYDRRKGNMASERVWRFPLPVRVLIGSTALGLGVWLFGHFIWKIWS